MSELTIEELENIHFENSRNLTAKIIEKENLELNLAKVNKEIDELTALKTESLARLDEISNEVDRTIPDVFSFTPINIDPTPPKTMPAPNFANLK